MLLKYIPEERLLSDIEEEDELDLKYSINFWNESYMEVHVNFSLPYQVSKGTFKDLIKIYILEPDYFISQQGQ